MPYASSKQRAYFHAQLNSKNPKIKPEVVAEYDKATKGKKIPKQANKRKK